MKVVGLGGPPGSGKSAVARELAQRAGVSWIDLDRVAWDCYRPGAPVSQRLTERFGRAILTEDGAIDRARLAEIAFSSEEGRTDLEAIVHPAVTTALADLIEAHRETQDDLLLVEGALLGVSRSVDYDLFDVILWLEAAEAVRTERLAQAGRAPHAARWRESPFVVPVHRICADAPIEQVASEILMKIERPPRTADGIAVTG